MSNEKFERSWIVSGFPKDLTPFDGYTIEKTYLDLDENVCLYLQQTIPKEGFLGTAYPYKIVIVYQNNKQIEMNLSDEQYEEMLNNMTENKTSVTEEQFKYRHNYYVIEFFKRQYNSYIAKVKFWDKEEMEEYIFPWPELIIAEVSR